MTEPSRPATGPDRTEVVPGEQLAPTLAQVGAPVLSRPAQPELNFSPAERPGEVGRLGRYRVIKRLGHGGMGAVYLGYDAALGRKVALKVMLPEHNTDESRERFLREARSAAMVRSDHVVTIFDVGEENGVPFIAMEYLVGRSLDQHLGATGELPPDQVFRVGREVALGLAAAHELGLVHRDVKPGNIWLEAPHGRVKLLDFGLAREQDDQTRLTSSGLVVGTPAFMSPEQARGLPLDGRSDLFSLGVVLFRLATGTMPFTGNTTMAVLTSLAVDTPPPARRVRADVSPALEAVIARLLAKSPADRYQTAWEVLEALRAAEHPTGALPLVVQPLPMAIDPQSENVWEALEESASSPRLLSGEAESPPSSASRRRAERKPSAWPVLAAGGALLAAVAILAGVLFFATKGKEREPAPPVEPAERPKPAGPKTAPAAVAPDRKAAEYALSAGGTVEVDGDPRAITHPNDLPRLAFSLTAARLGDRPVTDAGMANFKGCKELAAINLSNAPVTDAGVANLRDSAKLHSVWLSGTKVGDAGVAAFEHCPDLTFLDLGNTAVTDAGLAHLKECGRLETLSLHSAKVTDAGMEHLKALPALTLLRLTNTGVTDTGLPALAACARLATLDVARTKVTKEGVETFAKARPGCRVLWDGGTVGPADPDRAAVEYLVSVGSSATVSAGDRQQEVKTAADIPKEPFHVVTFNGSRNPKVTDAGLAAARGCRQLVVLFLNESPHVTDEGLAAFKDCKNLLWIEVYGTDVTDAGLAVFKDCKDLGHLGIDRTKVTDDGLALCKNWPKLAQLTLGRTKVTDAGCAHFKGYAGLMHLDLRETAVTDAGLDCFRDCKGLTKLFLQGTKVSAAKVEEFAKLFPSCRIEWDGGVIEPKQ